MKLLTASGLLYSAVQSQTVDGHYGAFPEIDWNVSYDEIPSGSTMTSGSTGTATIGLRPTVKAIIALGDGGKLIMGNGYYTGTVTFTWMVKLFGQADCGGTAIVSTPTGYNLWTAFTNATTT